MKKILIVLDSISKVVLEDENIYKNVMPFLYNNSKKSIDFQNIYSQGPYTMAGVKAIVSDNNILIDGNYAYYAAYTKNNLFNVMKNEGYINYAICNGSIIGNNITNNIDHIAYETVFEFNATSTYFTDNF